ncbi:MAG: hypothetical protein JO288_19980, partial [Hyphomicrobiales bacterium]|nr:hypothetical protein [Hyphomicrobiales bacterium]
MTATGPSSKRGRPRAGLIKRIVQVREMTLLVLVVGCSAVFSFFVPHFASVANVLSVADTLVFDAIITAGMTIALVSGGFDLSVGAVFACGGIVVAAAMAAGLAPWLAVLIALLSAAGWGVLNGFAI